MKTELIAAARKLLPKERFARSISILVGGTAGAQLIIALAAPLLTRLYEPASFGLLAIFTALVTFISVVACLRYELAIPLPEEDQDAANLVALSLIIVTAMTGLSVLLVYFFAGPIARLLNADALASYLWLLPVGVLSGGLYQTFEKWAVRSRTFKQLAKTRLAQSFGNIVIQLASFKLGPLGLIAGQIAGLGVGSGNLGSTAWKQKEFRALSFAGMSRVAHRYKDFPIYSTWTALFNAASLHFAPLVFVALYGAVTTGLYALTLRILTLPTSLIGNAVGSVFLAHAPTANREGKLKDLVSSLHQKLSMAGIPALVLLIVAGPDLFALVFGEDWRKAGQYAQWMAPWIYMQFQWSPLSMLASVLDLQRAAMVSQLLTLAVRLGALLICALLNTSADVGIFAFAVVSAITYLLRMLWFMAQAKVNTKAVILEELKILCWFTGLAIPAIVLFKLHHNYLTVLAAILFSFQCCWWALKIVKGDAKAAR
ncbi:MAG TPA: oligosaccharide flippase family protein [Eoetvoesiella sp.]